MADTQRTVINYLTQEEIPVKMVDIGSSLYADAVAAQLRDENGLAYGVKHVSNKLRTVTTPYLFAIAENEVAGHEPLRVLGYNGAVGTTAEDLWSVGGTYVPPVAAQQMEVVSSSAGDEDAGSVIKSGTSDSITEGATGILTLTDAAVDFTAATAVEVGDCLLLDGDVILAIVLTVATNVLTAQTYNDGFATSAQAYRVVDANLPVASTGIKVCHVHMLVGDYVESDEFIVTDGNSAVNTAATDIIRVNGIHGVFVGSANCAIGTVSIRNLTDHTTVYRQIAIGQNTEECCFWTVPAGKTAYLERWQLGEGQAANNKFLEARLRVTSDHHGHYTPNMWNTKDIALIQDGCVLPVFGVPIRVPGRADLKITVLCPENGARAAGHIEGWVE